MPDDLTALWEQATPVKNTEDLEALWSSVEAKKRPSLGERAAKKTGALAASAAEGFGSLGGILDPVAAGIGALGSYAVPYTGSGSLFERYQQALQSIKRGRQKTVTQEAGALGPTAFTAGALAPAFVAPEVLTRIPAPATTAALGARAGPAALTAAGIHDTALLNTALSAAENLGTPGGEERIAAAATSPYNLIGGVPAAASQVHPMEMLKQAIAARRQQRMTPQARLLRSEGVPTTLGQEAPETFLGRLESASQDAPLSGMKLNRQAAEEAWLRAQIQKTVRPGGEPLPTSIPQAMSEAYARFTPEYGAIKNAEIPAGAVQTMTESLALRQKPSGVDARTWNAAQKEVENSLTVLGQQPHTVGDLMKVRENLRYDARAARQGQDFDRLKALDAAEAQVTDTIHKALPPEAQAELREIDRRYAGLMTLEQGMPVGRQQATPFQVLKASERSMGRRAFKQGQEGMFGPSAEAAEYSFKSFPFTGGRPAVLGAVPLAKYLAAPGVRLLNALSEGRPLVFRQAAGANPAIGTEAYSLLSPQERLAWRLRLAAAPAEEEK